jgi:hypothetical protein
MTEFHLMAISLTYRLKKSVNGPIQKTCLKIRVPSCLDTRKITSTDFICFFHSLQGFISSHTSFLCNCIAEIAWHKISFCKIPLPCSSTVFRNSIRNIQNVSDLFVLRGTCTFKTKVFTINTICSAVYITIFTANAGQQNSHSYFPQPTETEWFYKSK